jgi:flagellar hook-basal body complex protein FliE
MPIPINLMNISPTNISPLNTSPLETSLSTASSNGASAMSQSSAAASPAPFADLFTDAVGQVNQLESQARTAVDGLMTGKGVDVHQAMIAAEKSDMAFETALAVHNKAVQAYQAVIGMQF